MYSHDHASAYLSAAHRARALGVYDALLEKWPVPYQSQWVSTAWGRTHLLVFGHKEKPALFLLHGVAVNAVMWIHNAAALSRYFCVYAVDIIGEAGKSAAYRLDPRTGGYAHWLHAVITQLVSKKVILCGISLGGHLAYQYACHYPHRLHALSLLAPAGLCRPRMAFLARACFAHIHSSEAVILSFLEYICAVASQLPDSDKQAFITQFRAYRPNYRYLFLPLFSMSCIKQLAIPIHILLGEQEVLYSVEKAKRICLHNVPISILPGVKHLPCLDAPDAFIAHLAPFSTVFA